MDLRNLNEKVQEEMTASHIDLMDSSKTVNVVIYKPTEYKDPKMIEMLTAIFAEDRVHVSHDYEKSMWTLLTEYGFFKSSGEAKRNWKKTDHEIPVGLTAFVVGKNNIPLFIWKED